jgi:hypothetical protein
MRFVPLLAGVEEWIKVVVPLVVFTIITLNRLFGSEAAKKKMQQQQRPRTGPLAPPQPQQPQGERQRVEDEVAEFLRRATQAKEARPGPPPAPPKQPRKAPPAAPAPVRRLTPKRDVNAPLYDDDPPQTRAPSAPTVTAGAKRIDAPRPSEIEQADEAMELQVHQALDHQVGAKAGSLAGTAPTATSDQRPARDEDSPISIGELLRDPRSIRDAIVVSEILRRPTERW